jgi:trigger factor
MGALAGAALDETREIDHTFSSDHKLAELAGKTARLKVTLKALKQRKVPALNDELAKDLGAGLSVQDLKDRLRAQLVDRQTDQAEHDVREQLVAQLIKNNPMDVPSSLVEATIEQMIESTLQRFARQGIDPRQLNLDFERLRESLRESAVTEVKGSLLLAAIADKESLAVTDADVEQKLKELSGRLKVPEQKLRAQLVSGDKEKGFTHRLREDRTIAFLENKAKIAQP